MEERNQEPATPDPLEDLFEPMLGEMSDEVISELAPVSSEKQRRNQRIGSALRRGGVVPARCGPSPRNAR